MDSVLIASNNTGTVQIISALLQSQHFSRIAAAKSGAQARRYIAQSDFDLVIIDTPLSDEFGTELSIHIAEHSSAGIMLIADESRLFDKSSDAEDAGVFVLPKPISSDFFFRSAKLLDASRRRSLFIEDQNKKLKQQIQEIRVIDRAKLVLVQVLRMTEAQAHRYILKQSMDLRQSRLQTAENILRTYEQ